MCHPYRCLYKNSRCSGKFLIYSDSHDTTCGEQNHSRTSFSCSFSIIGIKQLPILQMRIQKGTPTSLNVFWTEIATALPVLSLFQQQWIVQFCNVIFYIFDYRQNEVRKCNFIASFIAIWPGLIHPVLIISLSAPLFQTS